MDFLGKITLNEYPEYKGNPEEQKGQYESLEQNPLSQTELESQYISHGDNQ